MYGNSNLSDILNSQDSQIIRLASRSNLGGVLEWLGSDLLYVENGAHTPLVIINNGGRLFGFSISLRTATQSFETYDEFRKHMRKNVEQLQLTMKPPEIMSGDVAGANFDGKPKVQSQYTVFCKSLIMLMIMSTIFAQLFIYLK